MRCLVASLSFFVFYISLLMPLTDAMETFKLNWTASDLASFTAESPLMVNLRDTIGISCPDGYENLRDIWIVRKQEQYNFCSCDVQGFICNAPDEIPIIDPCLPMLNAIPILLQPANLQSVYQFEVGATYYLISFRENRRSGNCNETGLRMALRVVDPDAEPTTTQEMVDTTEMDMISPSDVNNETTTDDNGSVRVEETLNTKEEPFINTTTEGSTVKSSSLRVDEIAGSVGAVVLIGAICVCAAVLVLVMLILYKRYTNNKNNNETTYCFTEGQLEVVFDPDGTRVAMRTDAVTEIRNVDMEEQEKPPAEEVKIDLSQSFQQYEPMKEIIRASQSSLLKPMEEEKEEEASNYSEQGHFSVTATEKDTNLPRTRKDPHSEEKESNHNLSPQSSIVSFTTFAEQRAKKSLVHLKQTSISEDIETAVDIAPFSACSTTADSKADGDKSQDEPVAKQQSDENSDLINLQTPTYAHNLSPQSSIVSFTTFAEQRAKKSPVHLKQTSISEDIETAVDIAPFSACSTTADSKADGDKSQDEPVALSHSVALKKSQSVEFLDKMGSASNQLQVLPRKSKFKISSMENLADIYDPKKPVPKPRTLPRPKLEKTKQRQPHPPSDFAVKLAPNGTSSAAKRHSAFEKSGEVFDMTESL